MYGYQRVKVDNKPMRIHRAVALAWLKNPKGYKEVNHKDGDKLNNHVSNLEWCSKSQNIYHSLRTGLHSNPETPILGIHRDTGEGLIFISQSIAKLYGFTQANISKCLLGQRPYHKNYKWFYL